MHIRLKGLNTVRKRLANGTVRVYTYLGKGGPRVPGEPGSPEFMAAYAEATSRRTKAATDRLQSVIDAYQQSRKFNDLSPRTRHDYVQQIRKVEAEFGDFPLEALASPRTRGEFMTWRDRLAAKSRRQADYAYSVLALILAWGHDRGLVPTNPCERPGKTYRSERVENVWRPQDEERFMATAPKHIKLAFMLALWTGQRQGDLLRMTWDDYDGEFIKIKQRKTSARVKISVGASLKSMLDEAPRPAPTILTTLDGTPWTEDGFRASWSKARNAAGIKGLTFNDLRGTTVTRLAMAECSVPQIAAVTGHSLKQVHVILDAHYLKREESMAVDAVRKREWHEAAQKLPN